MGRRRKARELALQSLYELELPGKEPELVLMDQANRRGSSTESIDYARRLLNWVRAESDVLDKTIAARLENWDLSRVSIVCRIILRLALAEGRQAFEVPIKVIIDEAVELTRKYDSEEGAGFVNGLLEPLLLAERNAEGDETGA